MLQRSADIFTYTFAAIASLSAAQAQSPPSLAPPTPSAGPTITRVQVQISQGDFFRAAYMATQEHRQLQGNVTSTLSRESRLVKDILSASTIPPAKEPHLLITEKPLCLDVRTCAASTLPRAALSPTPPSNNGAAQSPSPATPPPTAPKSLAEPATPMDFPERLRRYTDAKTVSGFAFASYGASNLADVPKVETFLRSAGLPKDTASRFAPDVLKILQTKLIRCSLLFAALGAGYWAFYQTYFPDDTPPKGVIKMDETPVSVYVPPTSNDPEFPQGNRPRQ
jgi:hypothetical protein